MTNKEAANQIKRLLTELDILEDEDFNADHKENITEAKNLLQNVHVWNYET